MLEPGTLVCGQCGAQVVDAAAPVAPVRVAVPEDVVLSGPRCPSHPGMPLVGRCPRCQKEVCIRCAPEAARDRFTCTDCEGLSAAHQTAPNDARCSLHAEVRATFICSRCGSFGCSDCADPGPAGLCVRCAPSVGTPASRGSRFAANLIDNLFVIVPFFGLALVGAALDEPGTPSGGDDVFAGVVALAMMGAMLLGAVGEATAQLYWGQSIGKRLLGIKVVRSNGEPIGFWRLFLLRNVLLMVIAQFCGLAGLIDAVMIFGDSRRCLHDYLADSVVVQVGGS